MRTYTRKRNRSNTKRVLKRSQTGYAVLSPSDKSSGLISLVQQGSTSKIINKSGSKKATGMKQSSQSPKKPKSLSKYNRSRIKKWKKASSNAKVRALISEAIKHASKKIGSRGHESEDHINKLNHAYLYLKDLQKKKCMDLNIGAARWYVISRVGAEYKGYAAGIAGVAVGGVYNLIKFGATVTGQLKRIASDKLCPATPFSPFMMRWAYKGYIDGIIHRKKPRHTYCISIFICHRVIIPEADLLIIIKVGNVQYLLYMLMIPYRKNIYCILNTVCCTLLTMKLKVNTPRG